MRNPLPHLALAALILAPATVAAAGGPAPLAFKRDDWQVVDGSASGPAVEKACHAGTLAVTKAGLSERNASWCAKLALNCAIPLFCVRFDAEGRATVSPVDEAVLKLTVYHSPLPKAAPDYRLNRGYHGGKLSPAVAIRDPKDGELTASTTARPIPPGDADHQIVELTPDEKYWLTPTELTGYENQLRKPMKPADRVALDRSTRANGVAKNLPSFARPEYARLTKAPLDPAKVSAYLDGLIAIRDKKDLDKLAAIKKGKGAGVGLQLADALEEYKVQMSRVPLGADKRPQLKFRAIAVRKVQHFRGLIAASEKAPAPRRGNRPPSTAVVDLVAPELDWLYPKQRNEYTAALDPKMAKEARKTLDRKFRGYIMENLPAAYRADYEAAVAEMTPAALTAAILKAPHYQGADTELNDKEVAALAGIKNAPAPEGYGQTQGNDASVYYKYEMSRVYRKNGVLVGSAHLQAHEITARYRALLAAAGVKVPGTPGTDPNAPGKKPDGTPADAKPDDPNAPPAFTDKDADLKGEYDKELLQAGKDPAKVAAVNAKYKKLLAARREFDRMDPAKKKDFCANYKDAVVNAPAAAGGKDFAASGKAQDQLKTLASENSTPQVTAPVSTLDPMIKSECAILLQNGGPAPTPGSDPNQKPAATVDSPLPCGGKATAAGPDPSAKAGTDKEVDCPGKKSFDSDPAFYKNLANGAAFGIFGLVVGSFFGGPLFMIGVAVAAGAGGFMLSKHLNPQKKK